MWNLSLFRSFSFEVSIGVFSVGVPVFAALPSSSFVVNKFRTSYLNYKNVSLGSDFFLNEKNVDLDIC